MFFITMRAGKMVLEPATRVVRNRALPGLAERARIVIGELGEDAGAVGAASMLLRGLFAVHVSDGKTRGSGVPE